MLPIGASGLWLKGKIANQPYYLIGGSYGLQRKNRQVSLPGLRGSPECDDRIRMVAGRNKRWEAETFYKWLKDFLEAGKGRLRGDAVREATSDEVKQLRQEVERLKQLVADLSVANMLLKKSQS
jgi:transposase